MVGRASGMVDGGEAGPERRRSARSTVVQHAHLVAGSLARRCVALDLSAAGARLHLADPAPVPEVVVLLLPGGASRAARRRWRRGQQAGFEYLPGGAHVPG